jgi:ubiquinone/menaquinone biosynthesis C-methylase UbiE
LDDFVFPLACQAIPRICKRLGVECELPEEIFPVGADKRRLAVLNERRRTVLDELYSMHGVSVFDVFNESGIGQERNAIAREFVPRGSLLLDVATGRGYFAFACASRGCDVTGVDIMDSEQRACWWKVFAESAKRLGLGQRVSGIRSDGSNLPIGPRRIEVVGCVHAIRNFLVRNELTEIVREMRRVMEEGGKLILAESSTEPESASEEVYLAYIKLRGVLGWEARLRNGKELEQLLEQTGFSKIKLRKRRFSRDYAPVELPSYIMSDRTPKLREEYNRIEKLRARNGIRPTPVVIVTATVDV